MGKHLIVRPRVFTRARRAGMFLVMALTVAAGAVPATTGAGSLRAQEGRPCADGGEITIVRSVSAPTWYFREGDFSYTVTGPAGSGFSEDATVSFQAGGPRTSTAVVDTPGELVGDFVVHEDSRPEGFAPPSDQTASVGATSDPPCAAEVHFVTAVQPSDGDVRVAKTESAAGITRNAKGRWRFTLSGGPRDVSRTKTTNTNGNDHSLLFNHVLPGNYTLCERFAGGWKSDLGKGNDGRFTRPNGDRCVEFVVNEFQVRHFRVMNRCSRI